MLETLTLPPALACPGETCWRRVPARRVAMLLDSAAYFAAARATMLRARHSILLLGWDFDPRTRLLPDRDGAEGETIGGLLLRLAERPGLEVRVLAWAMALPMAIPRGFYPWRARSFFRGSRVQFRLDHSLPFGACHHQKLLVVDDAVAFCGGGDFAPDRWDTPRHPDHDDRRRLPTGQEHPPRHEVMAMLDGDAAAALGELARERWRRATGERLAPPPLDGAHDPWPEGRAGDFSDVPVAIARTEPAWQGRPAVREGMALHQAMIAAARRSIVMENQYLASTPLAEALTERLQERDGPEVILLSSLHSPSVFDRFFMDRARDAMLHRLADADRFGRLRALAPITRQGRPIIVHSKLSVVDDRVLRIGSANINHRSTGFDTECDIMVEAPEGPEGEPLRHRIRRLRNHFLGHHLGLDAGCFAAAVVAQGSLGAALDALNGMGDGRRLLPLYRGAPGRISALVARFRLGDPTTVEEAWRPWRRTGPGSP
ncbi:MAG: phospholipase D-like domain-containing protein [Acetobacteraceae bacterium]|nr:phospholipase D-like domain-containing protein [Acetobacteraceae bacterium]